jgi:hypothetical protein
VRRFFAGHLAQKVVRDAPLLSPSFDIPQGEMMHVPTATAQALQMVSAGPTVGPAYRHGCRVDCCTTGAPPLQRLRTGASPERPHPVGGFLENALDHGAFILETNFNLPFQLLHVPARSGQRRPLRDLALAGQGRSFRFACQIFEPGPDSHVGFLQDVVSTRNAFTDERSNACPSSGSTRPPF